jgi:hypothetical protein
MTGSDTIDEPLELDPEEAERAHDWLREQTRLLDLEEGFAA